MAEATLCAKHNARYLHHAARLPRVGHIRSVGRSGRRLEICSSEGDRGDYHQHVTVDSTDHTHKHKRPEKDVKVHPVRLKLGSVNQSDYRRKKSLRPHFLPSTDAAAQSAPPLAEGRRRYGGKHSRGGGSEGRSTGTRERIPGVHPAEPQLLLICAAG